MHQLEGNYLEDLNNFGTWNQLLSRNLDCDDVSAVWVGVVAVLCGISQAAVLLTTSGPDTATEGAGFPEIKLVSVGNVSDLTADDLGWTSAVRLSAPETVPAVLCSNVDEMAVSVVGSRAESASGEQADRVRVCRSVSGVDAQDGLADEGTGSGTIMVSEIWYDDCRAATASGSLPDELGRGDLRCWWRSSLQSRSSSAADLSRRTISGLGVGANGLVRSDRGPSGRRSPGSRSTRRDDEPPPARTDVGCGWEEVDCATELSDFARDRADVVEIDTLPASEPNSASSSSSSSWLSAVHFPSSDTCFITVR